MDPGFRRDRLLIRPAGWSTPSLTANNPRPQRNPAPRVESRAACRYARVMSCCSRSWSRPLCSRPPAPALRPETRTRLRRSTARSCASSSNRSSAALESRTIPLDVDLLFGQPTVALRGPLEHDRPGKDRPKRAGPGQPLRVPPRLSGQRARARAATTSTGPGDLAGDGKPTVYGHVATDAAPSGDARPPVLVLLRLQRLQQPHEGDWEMVQLDFDATDAARGVEQGADRDRLQLARGRRAGGLGRREARARRRDAPGRLPGRGQSCEQVRRRPRRRQFRGRRAWAATTPSGRTTRSGPS